MTFHGFKRFPQQNSLLFCLLLTLCSLIPSPSRGERLFVGILEADSYQSVIYGASAFSRLADLPLVLDLVQTGLTRAMNVPTFAGIAENEPLRIIQTIEDSLPISSENPANIALIPLNDNGRSLLEAYASTYQSKTPKTPFITFSNPSDTNLSQNVTVAIVKRHLLASTSPDALEWAWQNRTRLLEAPLQSIPGTIRVLVNPKRFADLLALELAKTESFLKTDLLLHEFESFSFGVTFEGQALTLTLRGAPLAESTLATLVSAMRSPTSDLWERLPKNAFFASLSACDAPSLWNKYLGKTQFRLLRPYSEILSDDLVSGDRLRYLAATDQPSGICLVNREPIKNAKRVEEALRNLHTRRVNDGITLTPLPQRQVNGVTIISYDVSYDSTALTKDSESSDTALLMTFLSLLLKHATLEATVDQGQLITVIGPEKAIDHVLKARSFSNQSLTLERRIRVQNQAFTEPLNTGATLRLAALLRHLVTIIPEVKPEQIRMLPIGGDGTTFGITHEADRTITASLRIHTNELAALQRINRDGRAVLQELFFQMFARQMIETKKTPSQP